jgi:3-oxoacyl-[acyl-carrier protein] reductase
VSNSPLTEGALPFEYRAQPVCVGGRAREIGSWGITVNNVQPGPIDTDLNPAAGDWAVPQKAATALDRYGHVDEIAAMVAFVGRSGVLVHYRADSYAVDGGMNA